MATVDLRLGDCLELMRGLPDQSVDAVITDPPYGVRDDEWDAMNEYEFARFTMAWMAEAKRIAKDSIIFCTDSSPIEILAKMLYPRTRKVIWHKPLGSQYAGSSEGKLWFSYECVLHCHNQESWEVVKPKLLDVARLIREGRQRAGLSRGAVDMVIRGKKTGLCYRWEEAACIPTPPQVEQLKNLLGLDGDFSVALERANEDKQDTLEKAAEKAAEKADVLVHRTSNKGIHPCEKPESLMTDLLDTVGNEYQSVLDPFMGSGTTGVACVKLNRNFIGMEINPDYFAIAQKRIAEAQLQMVMPL